MFRNYDLRFLIPYVVLLLSLTGLVIWYEVAYRREDSWPETIAAIGQGLGSAVSATFIIFATVEGIAYMVLAFMRLRQLKEESEEKQKEALQKGLQEGIEKGRQEGRQEERRRWEDWVRRAEEERAAGRPFDEPPSSEQG